DWSADVCSSDLAEGQCVLAVTHYLPACVCVNVRAFSLAFYLSPLNNVTYKHVSPAETNNAMDNPRGNTHFWTDEQTRFMLNQLLLLLVVVKRSSGNGCITTSCNENSATY